MWLLIADPDDYTETSQMLTFMEGISDVCTSIRITDDNVLEDDESFLLTLTTSEPRVTLDPEQGSVLIIDDDSEWRVNPCHYVSLST